VGLFQLCHGLFPANPKTSGLSLFPLRFNTFGAVLGALAAGFFFLSSILSVQPLYRHPDKCIHWFVSILIQDKAAIALSFKETKIEQEKGLTQQIPTIVSVTQF